MQPHLLKQSLKTEKNYKLCIKMQSVSAFLDMKEVANFWWKNADVSKTQGVCRVIYTFFEIR